MVGNKIVTWMDHNEKREIMRTKLYNKTACQGLLEVLDVVLVII